MKLKFNQVFDKSVEYFNGDTLPANVFTTKYALTNRDGEFVESCPDDMHKRLASEFARIEANYSNPLSEKEIYNLFKDFKYVVPQGSPMAGIGNDNQIQSISNCFVIQQPHDSYGGILKTDQELVQIAKRRGGVGFDISMLRPKSMPTGNAARTTDGIEIFMDRFSNSCREVAQGGRRGALMITISVHHPQIRDFTKIKRDIKRVTGANISIKLTDEFMNAVKSDSDVQLRWPVDSLSPEVSEMVSSRALWHEIIESAHSSAEPGLLFWDTAKRMTPSDIYSDEGFGSVSTNPCGEIILSPYDSCRLMLINLTSFVKNPWCDNSEFDYKNFGNIVQKAQRLMDDMVDLEIEQVNKILRKIDEDPEPDEVKRIERDLWTNIETQAQLGRRTGLGVTGVGDALAMLGQRYGSEKSIETVEKLYKSLALNAYRSSCILAKERGAFEVHNHDKERGHPFLERIWEAAPDVYDMSKKYGRRNIALTTTAPAGSVSTLTQTTSGIEPVFKLHYTRRKKLTGQDADGRVDFVDDSGDKWQEYTVYHHGFKSWMSSSSGGIWSKEDLSDAKLVEDSPYFKSTSSEIDWVSKVKMQAAAQKWVCHAISNTTNLPEDVDIETVKDVYMTGWQLGCKGVTVYREGSRTGVLVSSNTTNNDEKPCKRNGSKIVYNDAPKRPRELPCSVHTANIKGESWTILVGMMDGNPYEVIGGLSKYVEIPKKYTEGIIIKHPRKTMNSKYDLKFGENGDEVVIKDIVSVFDNPNYAGFTRTLSLTMRHGVPINFIVEQLQKDRDADLFSFAKVVSRVLKKYIEDGTKPGNGSFECWCKAEEDKEISYQEGCVTCLSCGFAKCG